MVSHIEGNGIGNMSKNKKMVFMSLLVAQALVLGIIEKSIPVPFITPGAKLGLANIITVVALYTFSFKDVITIVFLRVILSSIFGGTLSGFLYSISGGILSLLSMYFIFKILNNKISTMGLSVVGAVFHNVGQILVAVLFVQNIKIISYLPVLLITGVMTGIFVGLVAALILTHLKKSSLLSLFSIIDRR